MSVCASGNVHGSGFLLPATCDACEVRRLRAENAALRALVARFYNQAWEDPLTDDEMALLDPIVNDAVREQDRG